MYRLIIQVYHWLKYLCPASSINAPLPYLTDFICIEAYRLLMMIPIMQDHLHNTLALLGYLEIRQA